ncbi:MAG: hypothetical protein HGB35_00055 [Geobacteraceae bacterium]|nr:hypothetical protein [Geobacteraceae bacterium]
MGLTGNIQIVGDKLLRTLRETPDFSRFDRSYDSKVKGANGSFPKVVSIPKLTNGNYVTDVTAGATPAADTASAQNTSEMYCAVRKIGSRVTRISDFDSKVNNIDLLTAELADHVEQLKQYLLRAIYRTMIGGRGPGGAIMCYDPSASTTPVGMASGNKSAWAGAAGVLSNADFVNLLAFLDLASVPEMNRHIAYWPQEFGDLTSDSVLSAWLAYNGREMQSGKISDLYGFSMSKSTNLPYVDTTGASPAPDGATAAYFHPTAENHAAGEGYETQRSALAWQQQSVVFMLGDSIEFAITDKNTRPDLYGDVLISAWTHFAVGIARPTGISLAYDDNA